MKAMLLILIVVSLSACALKQLPNSTLEVTDSINLDPMYNSYGSVIDTNGGILAKDLTSVVGAVCIPDDNGNCNVKSLTPCLAEGSKVVLVPDFNVTPKDEFLISKNTKIDGRILSSGVNLGDDEFLNIKINVIAIAKIESNMANIFPGRDKIKECINERHNISSLSDVLWVNAASIIVKTTDLYRKVSSASDVTLTGIGISGSTYNKSGLTRTEVFLGLDLRDVSIRNSTENSTISNTEKIKSRSLKVTEKVDSKYNYSKIKGDNYIGSGVDRLIFRSYF